MWISRVTNISRVINESRDAAPPPPAPWAARPLHWALLAVLLAAQFLFHAWWMKADSRPPAWDESHHLRIALEYRRALGQGDWGRLFRPSYSNYPPLYHLGLAALLRPDAGAASPAGFNADVDRAVSVNLFYLALLIVSLLVLGTRMHSPEAGLCAALLGSFYT